MEFLSFFQRINREGIKLVLNNGSLSIKSNGEIDSELLLEIRNNKEQIIEYLKKYQSENVAPDLLEKYQSKNIKKKLLEKITPYIDNRPTRVPLSFSQERLWFLDQLQGSKEYHIPIVLRLEGELDGSILEQTLESIVSRHEILRTILLSEDGVGYQEVISPKDWILDQVEIIDASLFENILQDYLIIPFDLSKDYKLRACLYDLGDQKYILACVLHHIASDGWSGGILVNEFMELYSALQSRRNAVLPELILQYSDYAIWQRKYLEGVVLESQLSYWEEKLKGVDTLLLPTDYPRNSVQSTAGSVISFVLDKELSKSLNILCQREGVTLFMVMLSAFKVLLSRYSGQDDICVGTPIANRTQSELEGMIGFFVNTLALRSDLSGNPDFRELLKRVKETTLGSYDHQLVPFEKVVDRVVTTRDMSITPLFQVFFALQSNSGISGAREGLDGITISEYEFDMVTSQFDLMLNISEESGGISLNMMYCTTLFKKSSIERIIQHYKELLLSIVNDINQPIGSLSMLTIGEKHQLLNVFNDTIIDYPLDKTVVDLFREQVSRTPNAIAVVFEGEQLTYSELDQKSTNLAFYLKHNYHLKTNDIVGLMIDRGIWSIISILGILKSGACYLPIDKDYPDARKSFLIRDSNMKLLIIGSDSLFEVMDYDISIFSIDIEFDTLSKEFITPDFADIILSVSDLAYVIYTSGSTGNPKGVMVSHSNLVNYLYHSIDCYGVNGGSYNFPLFSSLSFDLTQTSIYLTLLTGGELHIYSGNNISGVFKDIVLNDSINSIKLTPAHLSFFEGLQIVNLKRFIIGGEQLILSDLKHLGELDLSVRLFNEYGPTEATIGCSVLEVTNYRSMGSINIGKPIANTQIYIMDETQNIIPIGVVGELCIGGVQVAQGYLNQEELTREKFISSPFAEGDRIYKTGDLARWLPDGNLEFIGRKDNQVKIRGYRIELGEIENVLSFIPEISQCCVLAREDEGGIKRLVAYVVSQGKLDKIYLQQQLKLSLPEYMIPMIWVELAELPLTSNGKVDRKALPDPDSSDLSTKEYVAPRTETEQQLAQIWENLLGVEKVGVHDNFFELGGHSLLATRLVSMIRKELSIEIEIADVFEYTTISTLGVHVSIQSEGVLLPAVVLEDRSGRIPLSFSQERLWFLDQLEGSVVYHIPIVLRLEGALDASILEQTLQSIVSRHEVLRTILLSEDGIGYQEVISEKEWILDQVVISDRSLFENILQDYLIAPFDLSADYKLRACLYDLGDQKYILACVLHHIASDGWSEGILVNEFMELYSALQSGRAAVLPELSLQYSDYAIWQRKYLEGAVLDSQLSYWEEKLEGVGTLSLPTDYARPSIQSTAGSNVSLTLDKNLSDSLNALCQAEGVTLFMLMLSAFKVLLSRYSGQDDICVGTPIANRTQSELEGMIGFFVNTLALRSDLSGDPSFRELLKRVKETTLGSYDHQLAPFEKVVDRVVTTRDMSMSPLFQVMFVLQNTSEGSEGLVIQDVEISNYEFDIVNSKFDLTLNISENNSGIGLDIVYCADLFDKSTIDRMLLHYKELLISILGDITQPVGTLSMLSAEEEEQLLNIFNDTELIYPEDKTIVDLFEEQVKSTPEAIALVYEDQVMTYKELDDRSNQLVHYFESVGMVEDSRIGILFNRSFDMIISILGVLKSGCTYVPLDPSLPSKRLSYILEDSGVNFLLYKEESLLSNLSVSEFIFFLDIAESLALETSKLSYTINPVSVAYIMYTSGTTGNPKGVMITHNNIVSLCKSCDYISLNSDTVWLSTGSISFDATTLEFFGTLLNGGQLILADTSSLLNIVSLRDLIIKHSVTTMWMTASWFHQIVEDDICVFENLTDLLVGGDVVLFAYTNKLKEHYPELHIVNGYGPTENTTFSTTYSIDEVTYKNLPIGKPIKNSQAYILDSKLELLPIGVVGELCVGGSGLGRGYLNQEELTREKFIENPFKEGDIIYKTGDLARWLSDGTIEFIGRKDDQVKIRGYRIELGEIENVLSSIAGIIHCCVLAKEDTVNSKRLIGYVVVEGKLDRAALQEQLKLSLPEYMVPMIWVELAELPLTSNGKLDKKALPDPDGLELYVKEYVAPVTDTEHQLVQIWENLLGIEKVGVHDNFFELGGHSLLATRLVSMIRKELSIEVSIREIFQYNTISALATHVSVQSEGVLLPAVVVEDRSGRIPLSFSQERLWFLDQLEGSVAYHIPIVLRLEGALDASILEQTLQSIVSRHEVLRTILLSEDGIGYQEVISEKEWILDQVVISDKSLFENILQDYLMTPFDLSADYKLRACLYDLGDQKYILACVMHHIASDGWSGGILVNEFMELYSALQSGRAAVLPELSLQYSDYAIWQRKYLEGAVLDSQLSYWEEKLEGVGTLSLPTDYARPSIQSTAGSNVSLTLDKNLSDSLNALCQAEGVTLFMLMLSAFKVLLSRYSGQDDICVGTPIANRTQSELEGMIGFFVNTLALRSDLSGNPDFRELLKRVKETTLGSYDHQLAPFEKVVDRVVTTRDMSMSPLFQVMFVLHNTSESSVETEKKLKDITLSGYEFEAFNSKFDLILNVSEGNNGITLNIGYCTDLFDRATIDRMMLHYKELLASIVSDITIPISILPMLTVNEEYQLLDVFNDTTVAYPKNKTLIDLFEEQVKKTPDAIAVVYGGEELSYKELNEKSNQLGHYLIEQGVKPDTLVGICLERSLEMLIGILGILKSGGAYVPVDPDYPSDRIAYMFDDTELRLVLTSRETYKILKEFTAINFVLLDKHWDIISGYSRQDLSRALSSDHLAYVIYTSGSTGRPKGVMIEHKNIVNFIVSQVKTFNVDSSDVILQFSNFAFDASVEQIFIALCSGSKLVLISKEKILDTDNFLNFLDDQKITHFHTTPSMLNTLVPRVDLKFLKRVIVGGEICNKDLILSWNKDYEFYNKYGPTEATITSTISFYDKCVCNFEVSIGTPVNNTHIYILDSQMSLLPIGVVGELCISGAGVARGYLNQEELTREKFIENPFKEGDRIYKTGDLARWLPDGNLEFIGRKDNQVKIRGYRIELGEIENVLSSIAGISQCCVLAKEDSNDTKRLVGYVVVEGKLDRAALQEQLKLSLPEYMVPMIWVELAELPLTSNGKLDRKALPDPDSSDLSTKEYVAPRTETEHQLVQIWENLLGIEKVGVHDNFFELGGHSLLATRLVSMIRKGLSIEISIREVFEYTTIATLSSHVSSQSVGILLPAVIVENRPQQIPLSFSQERLWFLDQLQGSSSEYHIPTVLHLEGALDASILEQTLQSIVSRHEVLRTILLSEDGIGYQEIISPKDWILDQVDITDTSSFESLLQNYLMMPFDLSKDYKLRACLYDLGNQEYILACVFHHIASDGWSSSILVNEFMELYSALQSGRAAVLPELSLQYSDYAIWQRKYLEGAVLDSQLSYWEEKLEGVGTLSLPTDYARPSIQSTAGSNVSLTLDKNFSDSLNALCQAEGVTLFMLMLSAFKVLLSRYSGQDDICVGTPIANRTQSELEGMIGFFVNTLALRSDLSGNPDFRELLKRVKETTLGSYDHQLAPFEKVVDRVVTTRDMSMSPLFQVMFILQNTPEMSAGGKFELQDITISGYEVKTSNSKYDLTLHVFENNNGITLNMGYYTALYDKVTIDHMLLHYKELLVSIVNNVTRPISLLPMLRVNEEHQLLHLFNDTIFAYSKDKTLVDLFEDQVKRTPDATAIVFEDQVITYKELDERSNQLVHYFESVGMVEDSRIGILFNRSFDMIISILGVLKSGCTYVPLDPSLPSKRLSYILEDSNINFILYKEESLLSSLSVSEFIFFLDIKESLNYESSKVEKERGYDSVAYIMYTSGTTGVPKGISINDENIITLINDPLSKISVNNLDRVLQWSNYAFDGSTYEIFGSLLNGACLYLIDKSTASDAGVLSQVISKNELSVVFITTALFNSLAEYDLSLLSSLRLLLFGGEKVSVSPVKKILSALGPDKILHVYGPTETTVYATCYEICEISDDAETIPIGKPLSNTSLYILDSKLELLPIGVVGELCVGGSGVGRGYLNQEELTREKFIENPFKEGDIIYKTGDLARWLADGTVEFIGRKDDQVKIRGYRIELGEIENILSSIAGIIHCCVLAKEDTVNSKRLIGYVVVEDKLDRAALQEQLKLSLPEYMVPMIWVELAELPLTSNGKLDKKALPDPDSLDLSTKEYVAPRTETEHQLVQIWENLLGVEKVGVHDNFFELGGHSLLATRLVSMIRKELSIEVEIADVFEYTTIATLSSHVSLQSKGVLLPTVVLEDRPKRIPLSFSQERLWFLDQLQGSSSEYHIPIVLRLEGALDTSILEQTLQSIVSRHEVLRTILLSEDGVGYQEVISEKEWILDQVVISDRSLFENILQDYLRIPFDLSADYKLRACLYDLGDQKYILACVFHHIASDGWSGGILVNEFMELYSALQSGRAAVLPELSLQYSDYAIWQRKYLEGAVLDSQLSYWEEKLEGVATLSLPTDYARPSIQSTAGSVTFVVLERELSESLNALCQAEGVTLFMLMLSAFKVLLSRYSGQDDICVGTPIANRTQSELEGMIGFFVNTLALRSDLSGNPDFRELLKRVKETTLGSYDHQLAPFEKVVDRVVTTRDMSMSPLFQVMFDFHNEVESSKVEKPKLQDLTIAGYEHSHMTSQFDLMFSISESDLDISIGIGYCTALFERSSIDRMLLHYKELLLSIVRDISQPISDLGMLTKEEEYQLLHLFNDTRVAYPLDQTVVDLFEEQVKKTPAAIAVVYKGTELTYKELDEKSNQLGHYLKDQGVERDTLVGICLERSVDMLIGILGILKSGGAYVPIKPDYPASRICYIAQDTGCSLMLTDRVNSGALGDILSDIMMIVLDGTSAVYSNCSSESLGLTYLPDSLSYVIYTSGSTGSPKGAMIEHSGLLNHLLVMIDDLDMDSTSVVGFTAPFTFDISVWQLLSGLLCGGRIAIYSESMILNTDDFQNALCSYGVTHLQLVPSYILSLLETGSRKGLEDLRYFLVTGETATISLLESWFSMFPSVAVVNAYGPAEASDDVSLHVMHEVPLGGVVPIGKPVSNMKLYVVDSFDNLCSLGVTGELWVSGVGVGRGYLNQEELTREKFISSPFAEGDRIYKTGDLARWLPDGNLEFIGRKDNQVKIRGYRIELGEIENVLSFIPEISQCCVLAREDEGGIKRLVAYVVSQGKLDKIYLQQQLKLSLPEYMIPMIWVELAELPLTSNGKVDRKALPDPDSSDLSTKEYVAPRTETEQQLAQIWENLLGVEKVGVHDNFFELGGHSLLATRLVSMIRKGLSIEISIREVFEYTTIEQQASLVDFFELDFDEDEEEYNESIKL